MGSTLLARPLGTTALSRWLGLGPWLGSPLLARPLGPFALQVMIPTC